MRAVFGGYVPASHLVAGCHTSPNCADKVSLFLQDLWWPDDGPYGNTDDERKSIEDVEPEFDCTEFTIVSLGEFGYSEHTSDLVISWC
jgi:hypothetical protein